MNGQRMPRAAVRHRGGRSFKNAVRAKPSVNQRKPAVAPVPMATGLPVDSVLSLKSCSHLPRYMHWFSTRGFSLSFADEFVPSSQWLERNRQARPGQGSESLCNFALNSP